MQHTQDGSLILVNGHWDTLCVQLYTHIIMLFSLLVPQQGKWHDPPQTGRQESGRSGGQEEGERRNEGRECEREWVGRRTGKEESGVLWCYWEGGGPGAGEAVRRDGGSRTVGAPFSSPRLLRVFSCFRDVSEHLVCLTCLNILSIYFFMTCFGLKVHLPSLGMRRSVMADIWVFRLDMHQVYSVDSCTSRLVMGDPGSYWRITGRWAALLQQPCTVMMRESTHSQWDPPTHLMRK